jgi:hypothetical protein
MPTRFEVFYIIINLMFRQKRFKDFITNYLSVALKY